GNDTGIISRHTELLMHLINRELQKNPGQEMDELVNTSLNEFSDLLNVTGEDTEPFQNELNLIKEQIPQSGKLINYTEKTVFLLLDAALNVQSDKSQKIQVQRIRNLSFQLNNLIEVEKNKSGSSQFSDQAKGSLPIAETLLKFDALADLQPKEGSELMNPKRFDRITSILKTLNSSQKLFGKKAYLFFEEGMNNHLKNIQGLFDKAEIVPVTKNNAVEKLRSTFDREIISFIDLIKALRIAELELTNNYLEDIHDDYFDHFSWRDFTMAELNACPFFVLFAEDGVLSDTEHSSLSSLISANYPVNIFSFRNEASRNSKDSIWGKDEYLHKHEEVAAMMLAYKNIYVLQTCGIKPARMYDSISRGLTSYAPSFIHILNPADEFTDKPYLWASSSIESRDFPLFTFQGLLGTSWGSRFNIDHNPQADTTSPFHTVRYVDENGEDQSLNLQFTFADQYYLLEASRRHYKIVPSAFWSDHLIPLSEYLKKNNEESLAKIPFIWMTDEDHVLHKVAIDWTLVVACQERLDFWRFLQENSGINNVHVKKALDNLKLEMREVFEFETNQLKKEHAAEIKKIKDEESDKVIDNLANVLLDLDVDSLSIQENNQTIDTDPDIADLQDHTLPDSSKEESIQETQKENTDMLVQDPYIETAMCTACDECIGINNKMFRYNEDKLAYIADSSAGTYRQLVEAAEACPVGIIHPGTPANQNEPDLSELIERANKFN
ncbi:MAG: ferredoxin, partial [Bacteroidia bacterium]|nr:ferredoxin [Bacteroidia bacterium]